MIARLVGKSGTRALGFSAPFDASGLIVDAAPAITNQSFEFCRPRVDCAGTVHRHTLARAPLAQEASAKVARAVANVFAAPP